MFDESVWRGELGLSWGQYFYIGTAQGGTMFHEIEYIDGILLFEHTDALLGDEIR